MIRIVALFPVLLAVACNAGEPGTPADAPTRGQANIAGLLLANAASSQQRRPVARNSDTPIHQLPMDAIDAPAESWRLFAIVEPLSAVGPTAGVKPVKYALLNQFDRISLQRKTGLSSLSAWHFKDVMRAGEVLVNHDGDVQYAEQYTQRVALSLAGSSEHDIRVDALRLDRRHAAGDACKSEYVVESAHQLSRHVARFCHQTMEPGNRAGVHLESALVTLDATASTPALEGRGWIERRWGDPATALAAPVVFDRAWLLVDEVGEIHLQRSKRRSGRGPKPVLALIVSEGSGQARKVDLTVMDVDAPANGPGRWQVQDTKGVYDLMIRPVELPAQLTGPGAIGQLLPVRVSGSHSGAGFIEFTPVTGL